MEKILTIIGLIILICGIIMIYDARPIANNTFTKTEPNKIIKRLKTLGFVLSICGAILIYVFFVL